MKIEEIKDRIISNLMRSPDIYDILEVDKQWAIHLSKLFEDEISSIIAASATVGRYEAYIDIRKLIEKYIDRCNNIFELLAFFYVVGYTRAKIEAYNIMQPVYSYCRQFIEQVESKAKDMQRYFFGYHG